MNIYKLENGYGDIEIGNVVEIDFDYIKVLSIVKVDLKNKIIWFTGVLNEKMF